MHDNIWILDALIVVLAARLGGELVDRLGLPAVLGEIAAGILIGPSVAGLVSANDPIFILAELGVLMLLFQVGLESDIGQLLRVGSTSAAVAIVGVLLPVAAVLPVALLDGVGWLEAGFFAGTMAATSVGITARVFSDLKALETPEASVVLGAGVADDVLGLLMLSALTAISSASSPSGGTLSALVSSVGRTMSGAAAFIVSASVLAAAFAPRILRAFDRLSKMDGSKVVLSAGALFSLAWAAGQVGLSPIIGAFIAGAALSRSRMRESVRTSTAPIVHFLVSFFFVHIGTQLDISAVKDPNVVVLAFAAAVIGVAGKLATAAVVPKPAADRITVGLGMIPRGEVGLVFAGIGASTGALSGSTYAASVIAIMLTTLTGPLLLRLRVSRRRRAEVLGKTISGGVTALPGYQRWLEVSENTVELNAIPPESLALEVAFEALSAVDSRRMGTSLMRWLRGLDSGSLVWTKKARGQFLELIRRGSTRALMLVDDLDLLVKATPRLARPMSVLRQSAPRDPSEKMLRFSMLSSGLWNLLPPQYIADAFARLGSESLPVQWPPPVSDAARLALYLHAVSGEDADKPAIVAAARILSEVLELGAAMQERAAKVVASPDLLLRVASHPKGLSEPSVMQLAEELGNPGAVDDFVIAACVLYKPDRVVAQAIAELAQALHRVLSEDSGGLPHPLRRLSRVMAEIRSKIGDDRFALNRLETAPRRYLAAEPPDLIARDLALLSDTQSRWPRRQVPTGRGVTSAGGLCGQSESDPVSGKPIRIMAEIVEKSGPLTTLRTTVASCKELPLWIPTVAITALGGDIRQAVSARWEDGATVHVIYAQFKSLGSEQPREVDLEAGISKAATGRPRVSPEPGVEIEFDNESSPWFTFAVFRAKDRTGLLANLCQAIALAGCEIHSATVETTKDGYAVDFFELTRLGSKLDKEAATFIRQALNSGASTFKATQILQLKTKLSRVARRVFSAD
jgi:Kef-type K+ transport system membrane component KefB